MLLWLRREEEKQSGQAAKKIMAWKFEKEMSFLTPFLDMRETHTNLDDDIGSNAGEGNDEEIEVDESSVHDEPSTNDNNNNDDEDELSHKSSSSLQSQRGESLRSEGSSCKARPKLTPAQEMVQIMRQNAKLRAMRAAETSNDMDETDMFYLSMARTVKRLPQVEQVKIRMTLCQLVSEAEIRQMEENSQSNVTPSAGSCSVASPIPSPSPRAASSRHIDLTPADDHQNTPQSDCPSSYSQHYSIYDTQYHQFS